MYSAVKTVADTGPGKHARRMTTPPGRGEPQLALSLSRHRGWHHPRNLPHFDAKLATQMITYRLADSLPAEVALRRPNERDTDGQQRYRKRIESALDGGLGSCCLRMPEIADEIILTWQHFVPERYRLLAWVVMPNHVHVMITVLPGWPLAKIVQSWKSWTGKVITKRQGELGLASPRGWQRDYWDRLIRNEEHFCRARDYIHHNPISAGLCQSPQDWRWSSAVVG
ncbi:MAG: transposase [Planctomycetes bacterium]|jgi:REP element-mobilizing transposase RayT|nr:transposase [Planctomycetota bacterium]